MNNLNKIKKKYIELANIHVICSTNGKSAEANNAYRKLKKIFMQLKMEKMDRSILIDLLNEDNPTRLWAASHMLGLQYYTKTALSVLEKIAVANTDSLNTIAKIISFNAKLTAKIYRDKGFLNF